MQTFIPYDMYYSVALLDNKRLNKQLVECQQLVMALTGESIAYRNHPAAVMWEHNVGALITYGRVCYSCYRRIYNKLHRSGEYLSKFYAVNMTPPEWLYDGRVSHSHRANLARKGVSAFLAPSRTFDYACGDGSTHCITKHDAITPSDIYCWPKHDGKKWIYRHKRVGGSWLPGEYPKGA